jgi:hypothetical protein
MASSVRLLMCCRGMSMYLQTCLTHADDRNDGNRNVTGLDQCEHLMQEN